MFLKYQFFFGSLALYSILLRVREDIDPSEGEFIQHIAIELLLSVRLSARGWRKNSEQSKQDLYSYRVYRPSLFDI